MNTTHLIVGIQHFAHDIVYLKRCDLIHNHTSPPPTTDQPDEQSFYDPFIVYPTSISRNKQEVQDFEAKGGEQSPLPRLVLCGPRPLDRISSGLAVDNISTAHECGVDDFDEGRAEHLVASRTPSYCYDCRVPDVIDAR
ncbi:MAG: hypothetical protein H8E35_08050 [Ardenticatenia bacterium]|nr:hypothetical protein [Ardenticatenia bacterium]